MTINLLIYKNEKLEDGILYSGNKLIICSDNNNIFFQEEKNESKKQEIGTIRKESNFFILENSSLLLEVNNVKAELIQLETNDIIKYMDFEILIKIYPFKIKNASVIVNDKKEYKIFKTLTFIGRSDIADIPAESKNPLIPISDYSAAIVIRENEYQLIPINSLVVKFKMKELKFDIKLEDGISFEVGASKFTFKQS